MKILENYCDMEEFEYGEPGFPGDHLLVQVLNEQVDNLAKVKERLEYLIERIMSILAGKEPDIECIKKYLDKVDHNKITFDLEDYDCALADAMYILFDQGALIEKYKKELADPIKKYDRTLHALQFYLVIEKYPCAAKLFPDFTGQMESILAASLLDYKTMAKEWIAKIEDQIARRNPIPPQTFINSFYEQIRIAWDMMNTGFDAFRFQIFCWRYLIDIADITRQYSSAISKRNTDIFYAMCMEIFPKLDLFVKMLSSLTSGLKMFVESTTSMFDEYVKSLVPPNFRKNAKQCFEACTECAWYVGKCKDSVQDLVEFCRESKTQTKDVHALIKGIDTVFEQLSQFTFPSDDCTPYQLFFEWVNELVSYGIRYFDNTGVVPLHTKRSKGPTRDTYQPDCDVVSLVRTSRCDSCYGLSCEALVVVKRDDESFADFARRLRESDKCN